MWVHRDSDEKNFLMYILYINGSKKNGKKAVKIFSTFKNSSTGTAYNSCIIKYCEN